MYYGDIRDLGAYYSSNGKIVINNMLKGLPLTSYETKQHEIIHKYTAKEFGIERGKPLLDACEEVFFKLPMSYLLSVVKKRPNYFRQFVFLKKFDEVSANYIAGKNAAERLKNLRGTDLEKFNKEKEEILKDKNLSKLIGKKIKRLEEAKDAREYAIKSLEAKTKGYKKRRKIIIHPENPLNKQFLDELEKTKDFPKVFEKYCDEYFPDIKGIDKQFKDLLKNNLLSNINEQFRSFLEKRDLKILKLEKNLKNKII